MRLIAIDAEKGLASIVDPASLAATSVAEHHDKSHLGPNAPVLRSS